MDLFDLSAKITLDSSEYERGINNASTKASGFGNALGTAAKVGGAAIAAIGTATAAMTTAFIKGASDVAAYGDNIDKMSQKMGLSAEAYQEWDAILQHSGTSIDSMARGMTTLSKAAESNNEAFAKLGISQQELATLNQEELFARTIEGLQQMEAGTERTVLAQELLGGSAKELGALLNTSAEDTELMRQRVHELGGVMSDEAVKAAAKYQDSLQDMQTSFSGLKNSMLSEFLPSITTVMDGLTDLFSGGGTDKISSGIGQLVNKISEIVPEMMDKGSEIILALSQAITANLPTLLSAGTNAIITIATGIVDELPSLIQMFVDALVAALPILIQGAIQLVIGLVAALPEIIVALIQAIPQIIMAIIEGFAPIVQELGALFGEAWDAIVNIFSNVGQWFADRWEDIKGAFSTVGSWFSDKFTAAKEGIQTAWSNVSGWFGDRWSDIKNSYEEANTWYGEKFTAARDAVQTAWSNVGSWFGDRWSDIKGAFSEANTWYGTKFTESREAMYTAWTNVGSWFSGKWTEIQNVFSNAKAKFTSIGSDIVQGVKNGITNAWNNFTNWVTNKFTSLVNGVKKALGIASPSKVFAEIGNFMTQGLGVGWNKGFDVVNRDITKDLDFTKNINVSAKQSGINRALSINDNDRTQPIILQVLLDGNIIGETSYNYMQRKMRMVGA